MLAHFGFMKQPFSKAIAPNDLFMSNQLGNLMKKFSIFLERKGMALLTGDVGAGKTTAIRAVLNKVDQNQFDLVYIDNPMIGAMGIFNSLANQLNLDTCFMKWQLVARIKSAIEKNYGEYKKTTLVVIDDACLLPTALLEELRLLTNFGLDSKSPLCLILMAQSPFRKKLQLKSLEAIAQRITIRTQLTGIEQEEIQPYIRHHLEIAGRTDAIFAEQTIADIYQYARGLPRLINAICFERLLEIFIQNKQIVDGYILQKVITSSDFM